MFPSISFSFFSLYPISISADPRFPMVHRTRTSSTHVKPSIGGKQTGRPTAKRYAQVTSEKLIIDLLGIVHHVYASSPVPDLRNTAMMLNGRLGTFSIDRFTKSGLPGSLEKTSICRAKVYLDLIVSPSTGLTAEIGRLTPYRYNTTPPLIRV